MNAPIYDDLYDVSTLVISFYVLFKPILLWYFVEGNMSIYIGTIQVNIDEDVKRKTKIIMGNSRSNWLDWKFIHRKFPIVGYSYFQKISFEKENSTISSYEERPDFHTSDVKVDWQKRFFFYGTI